MRRNQLTVPMTTERQKSQRGVALIIALLLVLLLTALSLAMVLSTNSDMLINGFYRNYRGSFYAADSGLTIARQAMMDELIKNVDTKFNPGTPPLTPGIEATVQADTLTKYGSYQSIGAAAGSAPWPEKYQVSGVTVFAPTCAVTPSPTGGTCGSPTSKAQTMVYQFPYSMTVNGRSRGSEQISVADSGNLILTLTLNFANGTSTFAGYGMFIDQYSICSSDLVPGTISGPVFTNGAWTFGTGGQYTFTDPVGSVSATAGYDFGGGNCDKLSATSDKQGNTQIAPNFQGGFNTSQAKVQLPKDSFNQERAVLDGVGQAGQPNSTDLKNGLRDVNGNKYSSANGVYLPYTVDTSGKPTGFAGGGIYVEGSAGVVLSTSGTSPNLTQVYQITQSGTTTTITVTPGSLPGSGTTTIQTGATLTTIPGVPAMRDSTTNLVQGDANMLYVNGDISSLSGPGEGQAAVQDGTALTITAGGNVTITGDLLYKTPPINKSNDSVISTNNNGQALGIFTANGDIRLNNGQSDGNLEIDASVATLCDPSGGTCTGNGGLVNVGGQIKKLDIVGGRIQNQIKNINALQRNVYFDRRYGPGFAPPWFPSTSITVGSIAPSGINPAIVRTGWLNKSSTF